MKGRSDMTEIAVKLECRGCGSNVEYSAKDQTTRCPYCGALTEIPKTEEQLRDQPSLLIPLSVELAQLTDAVYRHLASGDMTPDELLEFATFTKKERFYTPVFVFVGDFEAQWTASFGYDRWEDYTAYEKKTENGSTYSVPVTKTRRVTDWRPVNGTDTGSFKVRAYAGKQLLGSGINAVSLVEDRGTDEAVFFDPSYVTGMQIEPYEVSEDDAYHERGDSQVSEVINRSVLQHAQGDHQRDWHWTASIEKTSATMLVPVCHAVYEYRGNSYHVWTSGTNTSRLVADNLPVDDKRKKSIKLGFLPFWLSAIASGFAILALHHNWLFCASVVLPFLLFGFMRKSAILRHSIEVRRWLLANKKAAESNTAALTAAQQDDVAKSMKHPRRPWLSHTSHDSMVIPLVVLLASVFPFSEYLASRDTLQQTQYTVQQSATTTPAPSVSAPVASLDQNSASANSSDPGQVPDLPAATEETGGSNTADNADAAVQPNPQQARMLNAEGLRALAGPQPNFVAARSLFQKAVQLDPGYVEALNNLGDIEGRLEDYASAEQILAKVLAMAPNRRVAHGNMGYVKAKLGKIAEAEGEFCAYARSFQSFENGKTKLRTSINDADPQVQNAITLTLQNCRPQ